MEHDLSKPHVPALSDEVVKDSLLFNNFEILHLHVIKKLHYGQVVLFTANVQTEQVSEEFFRFLPIQVFLLLVVKFVKKLAKELLSVVLELLGLGFQSIFEAIEDVG